MTESDKRARHRAPHTPRHLARVFALLGLYQWIADPSLSCADIESRIAGLIRDEDGEIEGCGIKPEDFENCNRKLFAELLSGVLAARSEVEPLVTEFVDRDLKRVSLVERAILFLGTFELLKKPQTPYRVVLNEAIELAKEFGSGYRFTNAVLVHVAQKTRTDEYAADHAKDAE